LARTPESGVNSLEVGPKRKCALVRLWILFSAVPPVVQGFSHSETRTAETGRDGARLRALGPLGVSPLFEPRIIPRLFFSLPLFSHPKSFVITFQGPDHSLSFLPPICFPRGCFYSYFPFSVDSLPPRGARAFLSFLRIASTTGSIRFNMRFIYASALLCAVAAEASQHNHGRLHHRHHDKKGVHEKRGGKCQFPSDAGLVSVTPGSMTRGWAMSPDQPCEPGSYCPYACPAGQVSMQWDPKATSYPSPLSMVS